MLVKAGRSQDYYVLDLSLKVVTNEKGEALAEVPNHYMIVGKLVLDVFLSF